MNFRQTALLLGGVFVVVVALLVVSFVSEDESLATSGLLAEELARVKADDIDSLEIERTTGGRLKIERIDANTKTWQIVEPYRAAADSQLVTAAINAILQAKPTSYTGSTALAARGLEPPNMKVTLRKGSEKSSTINFGDVELGERGNVFVTTSARPDRPQAVPRMQFDALFRDKRGQGKAVDFVKWAADFRSKSVFPADSRAFGEDVSALRLALPQQKLEVALSRTASGDWQFDLPAGWGAADPQGDVGTALETFNGVSPLVRTLTNMAAASANDFLDNPGDLKQYGLEPENPDRIRVEMRTKDGQSATVFIGKADVPPKTDDKSPPPTTSDKVFVMIEGQPGVIRATGRDVHRLKAVIKDPSPLRDRNLMTLDPRKTIDGLDLQLAGQATPTKLRRIGTEWKLYGGPNDPQPARTSVVEGILDVIKAPRIVRDFTTANDANFTPPTATVWVYINGFETPTDTKAEPTKKAEPIKLEFGRKEGDSIHVRRTLPTGQVNTYTIAAMVTPSAASASVDALASVMKSRLDLLDPALPSFTATAATKLTVTGTNPANNYTLEKDPTDTPPTQERFWRFVAPEPKGRIADTKSVNKILDQLSTLNSTVRWLEEDPKPERLAELGFTPQPVLKVVVGLPNNEERTFEFGKETPDAASVYLRVGGKAALFTVPRLVFTDVSTPDLRDRRIFRGLPTTEATRVELRGWVGLIGPKPIRVALEKNKDGAWVIAPPQPGEPPSVLTDLTPDTAKINTLLRQISEIEAKTFETGPPQEKHGFAEPAQFLEIKVWGAKGQFIWLNIGASFDNGKSAYVLTNALPEANPVLTIDPLPFNIYKEKPSSIGK
ncbi:MAG: DUF4340 domain-containing protein [Gemmataceae bacterium]|nr:DUF4340 domain-containing protein [Gemmata sp.]MDW8199462.1 DUF4340 domain-containing protein [Gemmataceae bacterium]